MKLFGIVALITGIVVAFAALRNLHTLAALTMGPGYRRPTDSDSRYSIDDLMSGLD